MGQNKRVRKKSSGNLYYLPFANESKKRRVRLKECTSIDKRP